MSINIQSICDLSALKIDENDHSAFTHQLDKILDYMSVLNNVTVQAHSDYEWPINENIMLRSDTPTKFQHKLIASNAPEFRDNSFVVPRILD